jgi:hypothetical protein
MALLGFMDMLVRTGVNNEQRAFHISKLMHTALQNPNVPQEVVDLMLEIMGAVSRGAIHGTA